MHYQWYARQVGGRSTCRPHFVAFHVTYYLRILKVGQFGFSFVRQYISYTHVTVYPSQLSEQLQSYAMKDQTRYMCIMQRERTSNSSDENCHDVGEAWDKVYSDSLSLKTMR